MSVWTHVDAAIRIDGIPGLGPASKRPDLSSPPEGSEGPLQFNVVEYYSGLPWLTINIWGDLRDHGEEDVGEIVGYLRQVTQDKMVRSGIALIAVEGQRERILWFDSETKDWRQLAIDKAEFTTA